MENNKHKKVKKTLQIIGIVLMVVGAICSIIGFVDFFVSASKMEGPPKLFFMCFLGMPTLFVGIGMTVFGFKREISTYVKNESAPVINEMSEDIKPAITNITSATLDAINNEEDKKSDPNDNENNTIVCPNCGTVNDADSKFCKSCGHPVSL